MSLRSIFRDSLGSISRRGFGPWRKDGGNHDRGRSASSLDLALHGAWDDDDDGCDGGPRSWAGMPPELLREVVRRLEQGEGGAWPDRRHLVAFASVCRSWRQLCKEIAGVPEATGKITFPVALKQPGFRSGPIQCYIKRNKSASTYHLYLGLNTESGKFLLAARKIRRPTHAEYIISMSAKDISSNSVSYMGKIRSNFLGTKFAIYDSQPPYRGAVASTGRSSRRFYSKKVSPKLPSGNYGIAHVAYELNMLGTRGPRRMRCAMYSIPASALEPNGSVPSYDDISPDLLEESFSSIGPPHSLDRVIGDSKLSESSRFSSSFRFASSSRFTNSARFASSSRFTNSSRFASSSRFTEVSVDIGGKGIPLILKNKPPRWHEQLQCWCLNFRGRVTVASVKNFQLIASSGETTNDTNTAAAAGASQTGSTGAGASQTGSTGAGTSQTGSTDRDKIILQFGKIGKDLFTMDFRYPLSAFQAFAICLSSFDSKLACE